MRRAVVLFLVATTACATTHDGSEADLHVVAADEARAWRWSVVDEAGVHRCDLPCDVVTRRSERLYVSGRGEWGGARATVPTDLPAGSYTVTLGKPSRPVEPPLVLAGIGVALAASGAILALPECVGPDALGYAVPSDCPHKEDGKFLLMGSVLVFAAAAITLLLEPRVAPVTIAREPAVYR